MHKHFKLTHHKKGSHFWVIFALVFVVLFVIFIIRGYSLKNSEDGIYDKFYGEQVFESDTDAVVSMVKDMYKTRVRDYTPVFGKGQNLIMVFGDLTDSRMDTLWQDLKKIRQDGRMDEVLVAWKNFPSPVNKNSFTWAEATMCAHEQGKFWEFGDQMMESEKPSQLSDIYQIVETIDIDKRQFEDCFNERRFTEFVGQDMVDGQEFLIESIPYILVGDERLDADNLDQLMVTIENEFK
jgi:protein-disulfide isomerase